MAERLIALAEGLVPTREALEREFGFEFTFRDEWRGTLSYDGLAGKPFAQRTIPNFVATNGRYFETKRDHTIELLIKFQQPGLDRTKEDICVGTFQIWKPLQARGWTRNQRVRGKELELTNTAKIGGVQRKMVLSPDWPQDSRCVDGLTIRYAKKQIIDGAPK